MESIVNNPSTRAKVITRRTYNRPLNDEGTVFETWHETIDRVIEHQKWLWERAIDRELTDDESIELFELKQLLLSRKVAVAGRTLWLGGTEISRRRESSMFNCSFTYAETVNDCVDILWLLLQGCGVGFKPVTGTLTGFTKPVSDIVVVESSRLTKGGQEHNEEFWDAESETWTLKIGDSAEAWAKSVGKLLAMKYPAERIVLDFSEIRPAGDRLKGYGWISSGTEAISKAYTRIAQILSQRSGNLLKKMDILDVVNHLGTVLSSRRSAEIALFDYSEPEWMDFAVAKKDWWLYDNEHRCQSNNSLLFHSKPTREEMENIFDLMVKAGGSEPGFINGEAALKKAPWFKGCNPCVEILLGNKSFCNLSEIDLAKFKGDHSGLMEATRLISRANYRQTCVDLRDGILQDTWHQNNEFLHLCGVGITGIAKRPDLDAYDYRSLERIATSAAYGMADEMNLPRPKNVTTVKPSGTMSKIYDTTEGMHKPLGKYIFNNVNFSKHDPVVKILQDAEYNVFPHPTDADSMLVTFPVCNDGVEFDVVNGKEVNLETAVEQLDRYLMLQTNWCHQNVSSTISYDPSEVPAIIDWLERNWDNYIGVSFLFRADPTKTAADLGYKYLPQEVVDKSTYDEYVNKLKEIDLDDANGHHEVSGTECAGGACPVK
jgi:ribonucleoside-triphosphate reductase